jgi:hypothetical protein
MELKYYAGIFLAFLILVSGCTSTDQPISQRSDFTAVSTPIATPTMDLMRPLETSPDYVSPPRSVTPLTTVIETVDPIIGSWQYTGGNSNLQCVATFTSERKGVVSCSVGIVPIVQKSFVWQPERSSYSWMRNYTLTDTSDYRNYTIMYSQNNGQLMSDVIPDGGYLVRVG